MSAGTWFVDASRAAVNWGTAVSGGTAAINIYRLVVDVSGLHETTYLWREVGAAASAGDVTAAQAATTGGSVPAPLLPGSPVAPGGTGVGTTGLADGAVTLPKLSTGVQTSVGKADGSAQKASNLSDLTNAGTARTSLGLGGAAVMSTAQIAADAALTSTYAHLLVTDATSSAGSGTLTAWHLTPVDATSGAATRTLPAANSVTAGVETAVKKADTSANTVTVQRAGSDLIFGTGSGSTSKALTLAGEAITFVSNGTDRWTIQTSDTPSGVLASTYVRTAETRGTNSTVAVYYIDPAAGSDSNDGLSWKKPLATIQAAINLANTAVQPATIVVSNDRHDVGSGLVITKGQPVTITGTQKRAAKYASPSSYSAVPAGCGPVLYSSTGANPLVSYSGNGVAQGGAFQSICFECTGASQANAIVALGVNHVQVDDCLFFFTTATPAAATAIWAYNLNLPAGTGDDSSWWRITNNLVAKAGLVKFGSSTSDTVAFAADANQNVIRDNFGSGRRVNPGDDVAPFAEINRGHRTAIRDNNVERYTTGILLRGCFQCSESGDGGERTQKFIRLVNTRSTDLAPVGTSNAANIGAGVSAVSSIAAAGTGYAVNDTITLTGGTFSTAAVLTVTTVSAGAVTAVSVTTAGSFSVNPSNPVAQGSTSGAGTGATFNLTFAGANAVLVALESTSTSNTIRTPATTTTDGLYGTTAGAFTVDSTSPFTSQTIITTDVTSKPQYRVIPKTAARHNQWLYAPEAGALTTLTLAQGATRYATLGVDRACTVTAIGIEVTTVASANGVIRLGIWADDGSGFPTGSPLLDAGTIDAVSSTGFKSVTGLSLALQRGLYWLGAVTQGSPSPNNPQVRGIGGIVSGVVPGAGPSGGVNVSGYLDGGTTSGALGAPSIAGNATAPLIAVKVTVP